MSTENTIEKYLKDPLSMPDGLDLETLGTEKPGEHAQGATAKPKEGEKEEGVAPGATTAEPEKADTSKNPEAKPAEDPEKSVVKSKDGRHEIPYEVLRAERESRVRAERAVQDLSEQIALLQHAKETGADVKTQNVADIVDPDMLAELREESPNVADAIDKLMSTVTTLQSDLAKAAPAIEQTERESQIQQKLSVEESIAAVPKLVYIRTKDPAAFNDIAALDETLRAQPKWQGKPMQDRFEAAVRMYEAANGAIELPGAKTEKLPDDVAQKKVDAAVKTAEASAKGPNTLSDIPGGGLPATDEVAQVGEMSAAQLTAKLSSMTQDQQDAFLARMN